jgi:hypothetical protein
MDIREITTKLLSKLCILISVIVMLGTLGCKSKQNIETTTISTTSTVSITAGQAADDIMLTPGGPAYRANIHQQGVINPWPEVQTVETPLNATGEDIRLNYRDVIETKAGETRNNILWLYGTSISAKMGKAVVFTPENLPSGIATNLEQTVVSPVTKAVMEINISAQISTGEYTFNIRVEIDGKDYGQVPCTIKVIN